MVFIFSLWEDFFDDAPVGHLAIIEGLVVSDEEDGVRTCLHAVTKALGEMSRFICERLSSNGGIRTSIGVALPVGLSCDGIDFDVQGVNVDRGGFKG